MVGKTTIALIVLVTFLFFFAVYLFLQPHHLYDLSHASLHPPLPTHRHDDLPITMWQNMGYWAEQLPPGKISAREFPKACSALFEKVLATAGWDEMPSIPFVVELGFGCGDSAWEIFKGKGAEVINGKKRWNVKQYIGVTNNRDQLALAKGRYIEDFGDNIRFEYGNGGISDSWKKTTHDIVGSGKGDGWILAIDSLYHMNREKLFNFIPPTWNIAAFDLLLSDSASGWRLSLMEKIAPFFGIRPGNLITRDEYISLLVAGGWDLEDIIIEDISPHVFTPLSIYLKERPQMKWKIAGLVFGLLGTWGGLRGCVVVAKENKRKSDKMY